MTELTPLSAGLEGPRSLEEYCPGFADRSLRYRIRLLARYAADGGEIVDQDRLHPRVLEAVHGRPACPECGTQRPYKRNNADCLERQRWLCRNPECRPGQRPLSFTGDPSQVRIDRRAKLPYKRRPPPCRKCGSASTHWDSHAKRADGLRGRYRCNVCDFHGTLTAEEQSAALGDGSYPERLPAWEEKT